MNAIRTRFLAAGLAVCGVLTVPAGHAGIVDSLLGKPDFSFGYDGMVQNETALSITSEENWTNQRGNQFSGVPVDRCASAVGVPGCTFEDTVVRPVEPSDTTINMEFVRGEITARFQLFEKLKFTAGLRAIGDPDVYEDTFDPADVPDADPFGRLQQEPNYFEYRYDSGPAVFPGPNGRGGEPNDRTNSAREAAERAKLQAEEGSSPLEWAGEQYMVDLPQFYFDYQNGPLRVRAGNQQIAWGDLFFFRLMDMVNGLDLRRHSLLDFGPEEFSDKRVPSLGVRASYVVPYDLLPGGFMGEWEIDGYVQRFRSAIFPNPNTPYNGVASQFTVHDQFKQYDDEYNYGLRLRGNIGPVGVTLVANRKYQHWGIFHWTDTDVERDLEPNNAVGNPALSSLFPVAGTGGNLADTPFEVDTTGVASSKEYVTHGAMSRLDHLSATNRAIDRFPAAQELGAQTTSDPLEQERQEDLFLMLGGGLRGHITRSYERENNYAVGFSYRFEGPQDSMLFDQIDADLEIKYTPDRHYTPLDLDPFGELVEDEWEIGLVLQKFIRHSATFPSAFLVFQYLHRTESDIFNRHLSGYDGDPGSDDPEQRRPQGRDGFDIMSISFQQPFPNRVWTVDFGLLVDPAGGLQWQPGLTWKPRGAWQFQVYANYLDTFSGNPNDNAISQADYADEITTRIQYSF